MFGKAVDEQLHLESTLSQTVFSLYE